jgi:aryl carrier-like protein
VRSAPFAPPATAPSAPPLNGSGGTRQAVQTRPAAAPAPATVAAEEPAAAPAEQILAEISRVLRLPVNRLETSRSLTDQGLDSIMALELKNRLQQATAGSVTVRQILDAESVDALVRDLAAEGTSRP